MSLQLREELLALLQKHKWPRKCRRLNIVAPELRQSKPERQTLNHCESQSFGSSNCGMRVLYEKIREMIPEDFEQGPNLCFTINHNVTCYPHRDAGNVGESLAMFMGDFTGGELLLEDGQGFSEKEVRHRYAGWRLSHWKNPHEVEKLSIIVHNCKKPLAWAKRKVLAE